MQAADKLGIPAVYDVRYRINVAIITDSKRVARAARQIDSNFAGQQPQQSTSGAQVRSHCSEVYWLPWKYNASKRGEEFTSKTFLLRSCMLFDAEAFP